MYSLNYKSLVYQFKILTKQIYYINIIFFNNHLKFIFWQSSLKSQKFTNNFLIENS